MIKIADCEKWYFVLSFMLSFLGCYHLCYHLMLSVFTVSKCYHFYVNIFPCTHFVLSFMLSFDVIIYCYHFPPFSFSWKRYTLQVRAYWVQTWVHCLISLDLSLDFKKLNFFMFFNTTSTILSHPLSFSSCLLLTVVSFAAPLSPADFQPNPTG